MSSKLNAFCHPGIHSAVKSCRKPFVNRLSVSTSKVNRLSSVKVTTPSYKSNGAVDEEYFIKAFGDVPSVPTFSEEIDIVLKEIRNNICAMDNWEKRVEAIKKLRAVIVAYRGKHDSILQQINLFDIPLESSVRDLKSHVVREACITIAFLSVNLHNKFHHFTEVVFSSLMSLIQSSVKVISSSGVTCIRFILKSTHNSRLIPMLIHHMNSKSASLRCAVCEFIYLILCHWRTKLLERHVTALKDTIRLGICDASPDVRSVSRQAFWRFIGHFPSQEKMFLNSLDASYRRFLYSGMIRSVSSLSNSVSCVAPGRSVSCEANIPEVHNCEIGKVNRGILINSDSPKIKEEKHLTYSEVTKENLQENKFPKSLDIGNRIVNSRSGYVNEKLALNNSTILTMPKIKRQNVAITSIISSNTSQSTVAEVNTEQLHKPCNENCIDSNETIQQCQSTSDKKNVRNDNVRKIISNLSSTTLKNKVEGLVDLQIFLQSGNSLDLCDLIFVTDEMTNILDRDSTDYFGLLLDTLGELIVCHKKDLNYWLDQLIMHLLNKFCVNILKHFENRLAKVLDIIKESFPIELQLLSLLRFFKENTQAKNIKAIAVALNYIYILISITESDSEFSTKYIKNEANIIIPVLIKITIFATNENNLTNHSELQKAATEALIKLYNLNFPLIKISFSQIPENYQKVLQNVICGKINNSFTNGDNNSLPHSLYVESSANHFCDNKTVKSDEVKMQPPLTLAEIQELGCGLCNWNQLNKITTVQSVIDKEPTKMRNINDFKQIPFKSDSGICSDNQCSAPSNEMKSVPHCFNAGTTNNHCTSFDDTIFSTCAAKDCESELIYTAIKSLNTKTEHEAENCSSPSEKVIALHQLMRLIEKTSSFAISKNFKFLLRTLFDCMSETDVMCPILALQIITKMLNRKDITEKFKNYAELLIFQLLLLCGSKNKQVSETAMFCVNTIAVALNPHTIIRITIPLALSLHFPANVAAINMVTTLIKIKGREPIETYISDLMPALIKLLDSVEVLLRKSALFCLVALYLTVGEEPLRHYLSSLDPDKLKLLMIYIEKSKEKQQGLKA